MRLTDLTIFNYKNIAEAELHFSPNLNCFIGNNGEGKTNVLDAIHFLSFCRSYSSSIVFGIKIYNDYFKKKK